MACGCSNSKTPYVYIYIYVCVCVCVCVRACVQFKRFDMDAVDFHETLREPSVRIIPIFMQYLMKFSSTAISQLHLWHCY